MPLTQIDPALLAPTAQYTGFKNRIINGAMMIDQRNAGASVSTNDSLPVDRFVATKTVASATFTANRSTTAPAGFINSLLWTVGTGSSAGTSEQAQIRHLIEGLNMADFGWGTASAQTVTLSFWVRSSLTGTYSAFLQSSNGGVSIVNTYTINSANTWEQKSITIPAPTSGTFATDNTLGCLIGFDLGSGSSFTTSTIGSWQSGAYRRSSSQANLIGTSGATFYITGVQLEKGSTATSFDYRPYGTELALCQRYYEKSYDIGTAPGTANAGQVAFSLVSAQNGVVYANVGYKVTKRGTPTVSLWSYAGTSGRWSGGDGLDLAANTTNATWVNGLNQSSFSLQNSSGGIVTPAYSSIFGAWAASAEL